MFGSKQLCLDCTWIVPYSVLGLEWLPVFTRPLEFEKR